MTVPTSILFVCLGNICRSPLAQGVFAETALKAGRGRDFLVDSAGTGAWHAGSQPDRRSIEIAANHGIDISAQRARKVRPDDFSRFHLILGMDATNVADLRAQAPRGTIERVRLFLEFAGGGERDVPDPYYGGQEGFENVYRMIRDASEALLSKL
ncbi:MAG: low molecular weight protein-tyrosine-phosphatase [Aliihoeflea sp.]